MVLGEEERSGDAPWKLSVPSVPASVGGVRRMVVAACAEHDLGHLADTAALLASEVTTNALLHGFGQVRVSITPAVGALRVEVGDENPSLPRVKDAAVSDEGGRGLALVDALANDWGWEPAGTGKTVWFVLAGREVA